MKTIVYIRTSNIYDDSRATKEILALVSMRYEVHVLGWNRDGKASLECDKVFCDFREYVHFHFFNLYAAEGIGLKHLDKLIKWRLWLQKEISGLGRIDAIHACNLDAAFYKKNAKFIYDIFDYYVDSHSIPGCINWLVEKIENKVINYADVTIICTEERKEQLKNAHPQKVIVVHNSPDVPTYKNENILYDYAYCGALFEGRLLGEIFNNYKQFKNLRFCVAGSGIYAETAKQICETHDLFSYFGSIPYSEVLNKESQAMVLSAIYDPAYRNHRLCAPNKFYEALALGKPLIVCKGTGIDKIVEENKIGIVIPYDPQAFYDALISICSNPIKAFEMGTRARQLYEKRYSWSEMQNRICREYQRLFSSEV